MARFIIHALAAALGFWIASKLLHGVRVTGVESLLLAGLLLGVVNALVRPVLVILTLPLTILTLGLFLLVVNGITVWIVTLFIHGVHIRGPVQAILTALIISVTSWIVGGVLHPDTRRW
jgi:putative membrane protein